MNISYFDIYGHRFSRDFPPKKNTPFPRVGRSDLDVSKNEGTPKWMVYMKHPIKMDDLGVPLFSETSRF